MKTLHKYILSVAAAMAFAPMAMAQGLGVVSTKELSGPVDGQYTLTLESYVTGLTSKTPLDICLVLDSSGSMAYSMDGSQHSGNGRLNALKTAAVQFINDIAANANDNQVDHRISIIRFGSDNNGYYSSGFWYGEYGDDDIQPHPNNTGDGTFVLRGWTNVRNTTGLSNLISSVNGLTANGATAADYGMRKARNLVGNTGRQSIRIIVLFTDGEPTYSSAFQNVVAGRTINYAYTAKNSYNATIYTVGIFKSPDDSINKYMNSVSSNHKTAQATPADNPTNLPNHTEGPNGYYITATTSTELNNAFKKISQGAAALTGATEQTEIHDVITNSFQVPEGVDEDDLVISTWDVDPDNSTSSALAWTNEAPFTGERHITKYEEGEHAGQTLVIVSGFDYSANWCGVHYDDSGDPYYAGKKLSIKIPIEIKSDAVGGMAVYTNDTERSGLFLPGENEPYATYSPSPNIDIPIKIWIQKTGLLPGDSADFTIERALIKKEQKTDEHGVPQTDDHGSPIMIPVYDANGKFVTGLMEGEGASATFVPGKWEVFDVITITGIEYTTEEDAPMKKLNGLDPNYVYRIKEDQWGWSYQYQQDNILYTEGTERNPFKFENEPTYPTVKHAEVTVTNEFTGTTYREVRKGSSDSTE